MNRAVYLFLFLFNPILALVSSLLRYKGRNVAFAVMCFCAFYGASQMLYDFSKDSSRYRDQFYDTHDRAVTWENFRSTLWDGQTTFDVVVPLLSFATATVTRNEKVLFIVFGLLFGYFYGRNLEYVFEELPASRIPPYLILLVAVFALVVPFWAGLNGVRMWTGAHIFFFGASRYMRDGRPRDLGVVGAAALVHFSYIALALMFVAFYFSALRRFDTLFFVLFVVSFIVAEANVGAMTDLIREYSPAIFAAKTEVYTKDIYVQTFADRLQEYSWHARVYESALKYSVLSLLTLTFLRNRRHRLIDDRHVVTMSFAFLLLAFANFISRLPSGSRFFAVALLFALIPILAYYRRTASRRLFHLTVLPLLFWMVVKVRDGFDHLTLATLVSNPVLIWTDLFVHTPLIDFIK